MPLLLCASCSVCLTVILLDCRSDRDQIHPHRRPAERTLVQQLPFPALTCRGSHIALCQSRPCDRRDALYVTPTALPLEGCLGHPADGHPQHCRCLSPPAACRSLRLRTALPVTGSLFHQPPPKPCAAFAATTCLHVGDAPRSHARRTHCCRTRSTHPTPASTAPLPIPHQCHHKCAHSVHDHHITSHQRPAAHHPSARAHRAAPRP